MAATRPDATPVISGDVVLARRRGKSKAPNFKYDGPVAVIRLELDVSDERTRRRLERQWEAVFRLRRALQRDAAARCRMYWAAHHERMEDAKALRERLGLSRKGIEAAAKRHIEASGWMRDHLTKAVGLHVADEVWETIDRHLFADSSGRRHGPPRAGSWWDFTRIPGRARSHTKDQPTWETYRLAGTLDGHLDTYRHRQLPAGVSTAHDAAGQPGGTSILAQPARLRLPSRPAGKSWWDHDGVLAVVFTGLPTGDLVMPVRLPQGAGQWPHLAHFAADPRVWHKIDLVRIHDRKAPGGWRYYAHLLIHGCGYQSPSTIARRGEIPAGRRAGVDANVSNLSVVSFPPDQPERLVVGWVNCTPEQQKAAARAAKKTRARQKALDRSRRNTNADQYGPSVRQHKRNAAPRLDCPPARSATRVGRGIPAPTGRRCAPTATTHCRAAISAPVVITPRNHAVPARPSRPAPRRSLRRSFPRTATRSPLRIAASRHGRGCGASGSHCLAPACWWPRCKPNVLPPAASSTALAPTPPR
jgi:hypothetical protein